MGRSASRGGEEVPSGPPASTRWGRSSSRTTAGQGGQVLADERDLPGRREVEVERPQQVGEGLGVAGGRAGEEAQHALRLALVGALAGQRREAQQAERRGAVARRDRVVADLLAARDQLLVVAGGREEAAALAVAEALDRRLGQRPRLVEPALLEGRLIQGEQRFEQEGVVLEVGVEVGPAVLVGAQQPPVLVAHRVEHEAGGRAGGVEVVLAAERRPAPRRGRRSPERSRRRAACRRAPAIRASPRAS